MGKYEKDAVLGEFFYRHLLSFVGEDAANALENCEEFCSAVRDDILAASGYEELGYYNDDDLKLAIGRVIVRKFNAEV